MIVTPLSALRTRIATPGALCPHSALCAALQCGVTCRRRVERSPAGPHLLAALGVALIVVAALGLWGLP